MGVLFYYDGADIATGSFNLINHDGSYTRHGLGIKTCLSIEKYEVDVLGNCRKVGRETRKSFGK